MAAAAQFAGVIMKRAHPQQYADKVSFSSPQMKNEPTTTCRSVLVGMLGTGMKESLSLPLHKGPIPCNKRRGISWLAQWMRLQRLCHLRRLLMRLTQH
jgi:hypothetical protein